MCKKDSQVSSVVLALLGPTGVKAVLRTLMKCTPGYDKSFPLKNLTESTCIIAKSKTHEVSVPSNDDAT